MFKKLRATQIAAYFLWKAQKPLEDIKLMKLMYFSEREYLLGYGSLLTGDDFFCKKKGPILANTEDAFHSLGSSTEWNSWLSSSQVTASGHRFLSLHKKIQSKEDFDRLSRAMLKVLDGVYARYGKYDGEALSELTHTKAHCPEWFDPKEEKEPLDVKTILLKNGKTEEQANIVMEDLADQDNYDRMIFELNK